MANRADDLKKDLKKLLSELHKTQEEWKGENMPEDVGKVFEEKAHEAEELQHQIEEEDRITRTKKLERFLREIPDSESAKLPAPKDTAPESRAIVGYLSLGAYITAQKSYQDFVEAGTPKGQFALGRIEELVVAPDGKSYVGVTKAQKDEIEQKAVPTIGTGVIDPQRLTITPQVTADQRLRIRDVMQVGRTSSGSIEYVREESFTRAAATVAATVAKPQAASEYTLQTSPVRTIAVWQPATTQQLADIGQMQSLINSRLTYDVRLEEEELIMYGGGTTVFEGLTVVSGTTDIAVADNRLTSPTIIDQIRVGITEVMVAGYEPNAVVIHPYDWEKAILTKGTDNHYLAQVFPNADGSLRLWSLQVVETTSAANRDDPSAVDARNLVVGDFQRGAGLFIREDLSVSVGMINDDFTKNLRTVLAEERAAFAIFAPKAFAKLLTQASAAS